MNTVMMNYKDVKEKQQKDAYNWARRDMKDHGFILRPIRFDFDDDSLEYDENEFEISMFYDKEKNIAILRRNWPKKLTTAYNYVLNYAEIEQIAPNSLKNLLENGIETYKRNGISPIKRGQRNSEKVTGKGRKTLTFEEARDNQFRAAFDWAVSDQEKHGFLSRPARFNFDGDYIEYDENVVVITMFYDKEQDWAILRRDWPELLKTAYNTITNYAEVERIAPNTLRKLLENGVELYMRYKKAGLAD